MKKNVCMMMIGIAGLVAGCSRNHDYGTDRNVLSAPVQMGESGFALSSVKVHGKVCQLLFTGKVPKDFSVAPTGKPQMPNLSGLQLSQYITCPAPEGEKEVQPDSFAASHQFELLELEYRYASLPQPLPWLKITVTYTNKSGESASYTTPKIVVNQQK